MVACRIGNLASAPRNTLIRNDFGKLPTIGPENCKVSAVSSPLGGSAYVERTLQALLSGWRATRHNDQMRSSARIGRRLTEAGDDHEFQSFPARRQ